MSNTEQRTSVVRYHLSDWQSFLSDMKGSSYTKYREAWDDAETRLVKSNMPLQLCVELASYCNLRCKMCVYSFNENKTREHISMELVDEIVSQAKEMKTSSIWLGAFSEGLLHPQVTTIIRKFGSIQPLDYWFVTNGTLLTDDVCDSMIDSGLTFLSVSLDAASASMYKNIRGGSLENVEQNIMNFIKMREKRNSKLPFLRVSFVEMPENAHEKQAFIDKWIDVADIIDFQSFVDFSNEVDSSKDISKFKCSNPFRLLSVKYDGEIYPCCNSNYYTNNKKYIQNVGLKELWQSSEYESFLESLRSKHYPKCCQECAERSVGE